MKSGVGKLRESCKSVNKNDEEYIACQILAKMNDIHCVLQDKVNEGLSDLPSG